MHEVFLGIGGNMGNKAINFQKVHKLIEAEIGLITRRSSVYETPAWGFESPNPFWNQVLCVETNLSPSEILESIGRIDVDFGRKRTKPGYSSREMDIDILYFDNKIINTENLAIPHPLLHKRLFVLVPLAEIAPEFVHPVIRLTSVEMLTLCDDVSEIKMIRK